MYAVLEALGVQVVEVEHLRDDACYVEDQQVALVRPDLTPDLRDDVVNWLIWKALGRGRTA